MTFSTSKITLSAMRRSALSKWETNPSCIGMFVAEMDYGIAKPIADALHNLINQGSIGYLGVPSANAAIDAVCKWYAKEYNFDFTPKRVSLIVNVLAALRASILAWTSPGDTVVVPTPAYPPFLKIPTSYGRLVKEVRSQPEQGILRLDLEGIEQAFLNGARMLILCNPWNPAGRVLSREELISIAELCSRFNVKVFSDEIHAPLVLEGKHIPFASLDFPASRQAVTAFSASKGWNIPGSHCAAAILPAEESEAVKNAICTVGADASVLGAHAIQVALTNPECRIWRDSVLEVVRQNRESVSQWAYKRGDINLEPLQGTYIAWLDLSRFRSQQGENIAKIATAASVIEERANVAITPGAMCGKGFANYARMILATTPDILQTALDDIDRLV